MKMLFAVSALALVLPACTAEPDPAAGATDVAGNVAEPTSAPASEAAPARSGVTNANTLALEGLGDLRIGEPIPEGSRWAERGAQASDTCRTITSADYPGTYAIVEDGAVRRITAGERSSIELVEGIGVGATEAEAKQWFAGFRESPHEYADAPAKYLTAPNAESGDPALRFEIDAEGRVSAIHVGTMPVLGYVEGCA